jgi:hypothetical protein
VTARTAIEKRKIHEKIAHRPDPDRHRLQRLQQAGRTGRHLPPPVSTPSLNANDTPPAAPGRSAETANPVAPAETAPATSAGNK